MADLFYTRAGAGTESGADWANAAAFTDSVTLRNAIESLQPGESLFYGTPEGVRQETDHDLLMILNARDGAEGSPISFIGAVVNATDLTERTAEGMTPVFCSNADYPLKPGGVNGDIFLRVERSHYAFKGLNLVNAESFITTRLQPVTGLTIESCQAVNVEGVIANGASDSDVTDLFVDNFVCSDVGSYFALMAKGQNLNFNDVHITFSDTETATIVAGYKFGLSGGGSIVDGVKISNGTLRGGHAFNGTADYVQGDGIVAELDTFNFEIIDTHIFDFGDAGIDLKTSGVNISWCSVTNCYYGLKLWGTGENKVSHTCIKNCLEGQIQAIGDITLEYCEVVGRAGEKSTLNLTTNAINGELPATLTIKNSDIKSADPSKMFYARAGCRYIIEDSYFDGVFIESSKVQFPADGWYPVEVRQDF